MQPQFAPGHVGINVTDIDRSVRFYQRVFGWTVVGRGDGPGSPFAFLGTGESLVVTLWEQSRGRHDRGRPGLHHLSFQVGSPAEVELVKTRIMQAGGQLFHGGLVSHGEGTSGTAIFFEDPDGTRLEVFAPDGGEALPSPFGGAPTCGFF